MSQLFPFPIKDTNSKYQSMVVRGIFLSELTILLMLKTGLNVLKNALLLLEGDT
jgi:hypothetical protein